MGCVDFEQPPVGGVGVRNNRKMRAFLPSGILFGPKCWQIGSKFRLGNGDPK